MCLQCRFALSSRLPSDRLFNLVQPGNALEPFASNRRAVAVIHLVEIAARMGPAVRQLNRSRVVARAWSGHCSPYSRQPAACRLSPPKTQSRAYRYAHQRNRPQHPVAMILQRSVHRGRWPKGSHFKLICVGATSFTNLLRYLAEKILYLNITNFSGAPKARRFFNHIDEGAQ